MYKEDRKLLLHYVQQQYQQGTLPSSVEPTHPTPVTKFKPRPILVDKQITSEPATPTSTSASCQGNRLASKPIIQRNLSDLSQRIKKRVTYRGLPFNDPPSRAQSAVNFLTASNIPLNVTVAPVSALKSSTTSHQHTKADVITEAPSTTQVSDRPSTTYENNIDSFNRTTKLPPLQLHVPSCSAHASSMSSTSGYDADNTPLTLTAGRKYLNQPSPISIPRYTEDNSYACDINLSVGSTSPIMSSAGSNNSCFFNSETDLISPDSHTADNHAFNQSYGLNPSHHQCHSSHHHQQQQHQPQPVHSHSRLNPASSQPLAQQSSLPSRITTGSVLSTLNEQRSVESDTNIPILPNMDTNCPCNCNQNQQLKDKHQLQQLQKQYRPPQMGSTHLTQDSSQRASSGHDTDSTNHAVGNTESSVDPSTAVKANNNNNRKKNDQSCTDRTVGTNKSVNISIKSNQIKEPSDAVGDLISFPLSPASGGTKYVPVASAASASSLPFARSNSSPPTSSSPPWAPSPTPPQPDSDDKEDLTLRVENSENSNTVLCQEGNRLSREINKPSPKKDNSGNLESVELNFPSASAKQNSPSRINTGNHVIFHEHTTHL